MDHRRKWNVNDYAVPGVDNRGNDEDSDDGKTAKKVKRDLLSARDYKIDLDSKLGKTVVVTKTTPQSQAGGYYCNVCDCLVKDSINFLDHINGKKHQRNMGMSMKLERSTVDDVKKRLEMNKKKREETKKEYSFEDRLKELKEDEEKAKARRLEKKKEKKQAEKEAASAQEANEDDDGMAALMGFSTFSTSKK